MPILANVRHEKFAQELATGKSATEAYRLAGFKPNQPNAARLISNDMVKARVTELQSKSAERVLVTLDSLTQELEEARAGAMACKQHAAAVTAAMGKAKLHGLLIEKQQLTGADGGPVQVIIANADAELL